jgi:hypothetical protein
MLADRAPYVDIDRPVVLQALMREPNTVWTNLLEQAHNNGPQTLCQTEVARVSAGMNGPLILMTKSCCRNCRKYYERIIVFVVQRVQSTPTCCCSCTWTCCWCTNYTRNRCMLALCGVVISLSLEQISQAVASQGPLVTKHTQYKAMRGAQADILQLIITFYEVAGANPVRKLFVMRQSNTTFMTIFDGLHFRRTGRGTSSATDDIHSSALGMYMSRIPKISTRNARAYRPRCACDDGR